MKVFINPGHCPGVDPGAVNNELGITEAGIVHDIGTRVTDYLDKAGCEVSLLQSDNLYYDGEGECVVAAANKWAADVFVSLHCNAFNGTAKGTETCIYKLNSNSERLGRCIQDQIVNSLGTVDRGLKERPGLVVLTLLQCPPYLLRLPLLTTLMTQEFW